MTASLEPDERVVLERMRFAGTRYDQWWTHGLVMSDDRIELLDG